MEHNGCIYNKLIFLFYTHWFKNKAGLAVDLYMLVSKYVTFKDIFKKDILFKFYQKTKQNKKKPEQMIYKKTH